MSPVKSTVTVLPLKSRPGRDTGSPSSIGSSGIVPSENSAVETALGPRSGA